MANLNVLDFGKYLMNGLRADPRNPRNTEFLVTCLNAKPTEYGLSDHETITYPITTAGLELATLLNWPNPLVFRGKNKTLLFARNAIYEVSETDWSAAELSLYKAGAPLTANECLNENDFATKLKWTEGTGWAIAAGIATHTAGNTATLSQTTTNQKVTMEAGKLYRVWYALSGVTAGSIQVKLGSTGTAGDARTQDGSYVEDLVCAGTADFIITPTSTFAGSVDNVYVKEVKAAAIPNGSGPWHVADFQNVWFAANGTSLVAKLFYNGRWTTYVMQDQQTSPALYLWIPKTVCNFQNRLLMGGIPTATPYIAGTTPYGTGNDQAAIQAEWAELWQLWLENSPRDIMTYEDLTMGPNVIFYSTQSGGDYHWPFAAEMAMMGLPGSEEVGRLKPLFQDLIKAGEIGFIPMPWQGNIHVLKQLGNAVVAYGDAGVTAVIPQQEDGMALYRTVNLVDVGVASRGAVGGDTHNHVFIDVAKNMWLITEDFKVTRLGYSEVMTNFTAANIVVSHDPDQGDFYMCDGTYGWVRSKTGLGRVQKMPTGLSYISTGLIGAYSPSSAGDGNFNMITDTFDMGMRSIKTVKNVEIAATDVTNLMVTVGYKFANALTWSWSEAHTVTQEGFAFPIISATDFRLKITGTFGTAGKIDGVVVRWTDDDKRAHGRQLSKYV